MGTYPQIRAIGHTKGGQADSLEAGPAHAHLEGGSLGREAGVGWPQLPPPRRAARSWARCGQPAAPSLSLLSLHSVFPLVGTGPAWLCSTPPENSMYPLQQTLFKCLSKSHLGAQVAFPNSRAAEGSQFTTSRTGILRYQISARTKGSSNKREAGRCFRQNTWCSN